MKFTSFAGFVLAAIFLINLSTRMLVLLNCVPFGTDVFGLLGRLFSYKHLIAAKISLAGHNVSVRVRYDGSSGCWLTCHGFRRYIHGLRS